MASGKTHQLVNTLASVPAALGLHLNGTPIEFTATGLAGYTLATFLINPDLDTNSRPYYAWGIFRLVWLPYKALSSHRGVSHIPFIGTLIRVVYFAAIVWLALFAVFALFLGNQGVSNYLAFWRGVAGYGPYIAMFFLGMCVSDILHIVLDHVSTGYKRSRFNKKSRY